VNPSNILPVAVVRLADLCVPFLAGFLSAIAKHLLRVGSAQLLDADQVAAVSWNALSRTPNGWLVGSRTTSASLAYPPLGAAVDRPP
jgi:hypothetical protein